VCRGQGPYHQELGESIVSSCLACCYGSQDSQWKKLEEVGPVLWKLCQLNMACGKQRQGQQQNMVDLNSSGLGNSKHTASPGYHTWWFELSTGLCATWDWNSPSRTGLTSSHCGASAVMNSGSHPEHRMSRIDKSSHTRHAWGYMETQSPVDLTSLVL
jgi:hypothetical protein